MEIKKLTLNYTWKHKQPRIAKIILNHLKKKKPIDAILSFISSYTTQLK